MPIIPSNANRRNHSVNTVQTADTIEVVRTKLRGALAPYFKGKTAPDRLEKAVSDAIHAITGFITVREVSGQKLGGTVMTESASMRNPTTGEFSKPPRNL